MKMRKNKEMGNDIVENLIYLFEKEPKSNRDDIHSAQLKEGQEITNKLIYYFSDEKPQNN